MSKAFRLGAFLLATLAILSFGIFQIGNKQFMFRRTYRVRAEFPNVTGLTEGADVRVGGIRRGTVRKIELPQRPDGKVVVVVDLDNATRSLVKKDSTVSIKSEGLLGDKYAEVSFGSNDAERVKDGDTISAAPPVDMSDLMKATGDILSSTKDTMQNMQEISAKVNQGQGSLGAMINDKQIYKQATAATTQAQEGAAAFKENMEAMKHNFLLRGFFRKRGYENETDLTKHAIARM